MTAFFSPLRDAFTALLGGLGGAALAWLWFAEQRAPIVVLVLTPVVIAGYTWARVTPDLIHHHPERAVTLYNRMTVVYIGLTAVASAIAIILLVQFAWAENAPSEETKKSVSALSTALTTFIGAVLVSTDETDATIGAMVARRFTSAFGQADGDEIPDGNRYATRPGDSRWYLEMGSRGLVAANEDEYFNGEGWGRAVRRRRAKDIEAFLRPKRQRAP